MDKIKEFFKRQSIGFYVGAGAMIMLLVATIMLSANSKMEYYNDFSAGPLVLGLVALIVGIAILVVNQFVKIPHFNALWIVCVVLAAVAFMLVLANRVESMAIILGSDLEKDNALAQAAMSNFIATMVINIIAIVAIVVASFFKVTKTDK